MKSLVRIAVLISCLIAVATFSRCGGGARKEVVYEEVEHRPPKQILSELAKLEEEITQGG